MSSDAHLDCPALNFSRNGTIRGNGYHPDDEIHAIDHADELKERTCQENIQADSLIDEGKIKSSELREEVSHDDIQANLFLDEDEDSCSNDEDVKPEIEDIKINEEDVKLLFSEDNIIKSENSEKECKLKPENICFETKEGLLIPKDEVQEDEGMSGVEDKEEDYESKDEEDLLSDEDNDDLSESDEEEV